MKNHIIKAVAVLMAFITLMSVLPLAALAELMPAASAPYDLNGDGVIDAADADIFASVQQGKDQAGATYDAAMGVTVNGKQYDISGGSEIVNSTYSPYEPVKTNDATHPFIQGGAAWIDLRNLFYGAPATPNYPITKWSANTSVVNITATGDTHSAAGYPIDGKPIYALPDMNLVDEYTWANSNTYTAVIDGEQQNGILDSVDNVYIPANGVTNGVTQKNGERAYVYNRYDPMQGKWGLTLDRNVGSVVFTPSWRGNYYGEGKSMNNSILYLTKTPYLYYSTEAPDSTKIAISLLIGTPVQSEYKTGANGTNFEGTVAKEKQHKVDADGNVVKNSEGKAEVYYNDSEGIVEYTYRWYTITDNIARPGIGTDTRDNSMTPNVHISSVVLENCLEGKKDDQNSAKWVVEKIANGYNSYAWDGTTWVNGDSTKLDPIALANRDANDETNTAGDALFVDGSITGCIDFTTILPVLMGVSNGADDYFEGSFQDVRYKIAQVRIDTKTADGEANSAARLNYMYFGPGQSTVYTPQSTFGSSVNAANWQYAQNTSNVGNGNENLADTGDYYDDPNRVALQKHNTEYAGDGHDSAYTNGWENGDAVSIINTPNDPQKIVIDTYGNGGGYFELPKYAVDAEDGLKYPTYALGNDVTSKDDSWMNAEGTDAKADGNKFVDHSKLWKVDVDGDGQVETFEAEYNRQDGKYYIMVTLPIRKWVNVIGDSRKISMNISMQQGTMKPSFVLWGNSIGSYGSGHSTTGTRFDAEDILAIFGEGYYQVDNADDFMTVLIDETIGKSTVYNTEEVVTLHHRPGAHDGSENPDVTVEEVKDLHVYTDDQGKTYYKSSHGTWYTVKPDTVTSNDKEYPLYVHWADSNHPTYYYDAENFKLYNTHDGSEITSNLSINVMEPLYVFNEIKDEAAKPQSPIAQYGSDETWVDLLRSPYMYKRYVKGGDTSVGYGSEMEGYVFVTSLRFAVPVGTKFTIQNMKGDNNSAGLNMYSTQGSVVNAYDGGTGEQPEIDMNNNDLGEWEYTDKGEIVSIGNINGKKTAGAAAYGPMLRSSNYTIYDLLDTESLNNSNNVFDTSAGEEKGEARQTVYGVPTYTKEQLSIFAMPNGKKYTSSSSDQNFTNSNGTDIYNPCYGYIPSGGSLCVFGLLRFTDELTGGGLAYWGLVAVVTSGGSTEFGWVRLYGNGSWSSKEISIYDKSLAFSVELTSQLSISHSYLNTLYAKLNDKWYYSNAEDVIERTYDIKSDKTAKVSKSAAQFLHSDGLPMPMIANFQRGYNGFNGLYAVENHRVESTNTTDMKIKQYGYSQSGWPCIGMTRMLSEPIVLRNTTETWNGGNASAGDNRTWPVLYYDFDAMKTSNNGTAGLQFSLIVSYYDKDGKKVKDEIVYLQQDGKDWTRSMPHNRDSGGAGYVSLKKICDYAVTNAGTGATAQVRGMSICYAYDGLGDGTKISAEMVMRRFEIWMDETPYLDAIMNASKTDDTWYYNSSSSASASDHVADAFNIINDAFYYTDTTDTGNNNSNRKKNSNRGWSALIRMDTNNDGKLDASDASYNSYDAYSVDNVYEYQTSLGHLRAWVPAGTEASVAFTSDRSFSFSNYKYLYYSYSVRDPKSGIAAADSSEVPGITVAIKSQQAQADMAYIQGKGTNGTSSWVFYGNGQNYWDGTTDHRGDGYTTTMNASLDLSSLKGITSINQLVFYLNNKGTLNSTAEFYINYIYLSNVAPTQHIKKLTRKSYTQYYYLMDNTGDRYSARFPTIDNPSGAVTGTNSDNDRVNPVKVERGDYLMYGTYFNGDPLYGYGGTYGDNRTYNENVASEGFYEKTYGCTDTSLKVGSLKNILFYMGENQGGNEKDYTDILDYYQYKDRNGDGTGDVTDMLWSYGRWYLGTGDSGMNTMYVEDPASQPVGNLTRRYATENYVLLRSGIEPRRYTTYYWAGEAGEFFYEGSDALAGDIGNTATNNSYYITETVLNDYFTMPRDVDLLGDGKKDDVIPVRYGYTFNGWLASDGTKIENGHLQAFDRKQEPGMDYFVADWKKDADYTDVKPEAKFYNREADDEDKSVWVTRTAVQDAFYQIILPSIGLMWTPNGNMIVSGWKAWEDEACTVPYEVSDTENYLIGEDGNVVFENGKPVYAKKQLTYYSASTIILKGKDLWFTPILVDPDSAEGVAKDLISVIVTNAELKLYIDGKDGDFVTNDPAKQGIGVKQGDNSNTLVYYNIPKGTAMVAYPKTGGYQAGNVWTTPSTTDGKVINADANNAPSVIGTNANYYRFAASNTGINITYGAPIPKGPDDTTEETIGGVTTFVEPKIVNRQMTFSSQYQDVEGYTVAAYGTIYMNGKQEPGKEFHANYIKYMQLNPSSITSETVQKGSFKTALSGIKQVMATKANMSNQYALTYAASTEKEHNVWMRGYVIYEKDGEYFVTYSSLIVYAGVKAYSSSNKTEEV